jgi:ribosomal protein S1
VTGEVTKITDFGAFVKLEDGVEGLVHVSELDWGHVAHPRDVLKEHQTVEVKILNVDPKERRISLSIRALKTDPWRQFVERYAIDSLVEGEITEINDVDGLIHVSEISDQRIATPTEVLTVGDKVQAKIIGINEEKKQVRLSMRNLFGPPAVPPSRPPRVAGKRPRKRERTEDSFLEDGGGHETLSMRDMLGDKGLEEEE